MKLLGSGGLRNKVKRIQLRLIRVENEAADTLLDVEDSTAHQVAAIGYSLSGKSTRRIENIARETFPIRL